jgi:MYXO-CTERM domain-containing protein
MRHFAISAATAAACVAALVASFSPLAQAQVASGASVSGFASGTFQVGCTTCPHYVLTLTGSDTAPMIFDGGDGVLSAAASATFVPDRQASGVPDEYTLGGSIAMAASAGFEGPMGTPQLRAFAQADNVQVFMPNPTGGVQFAGIDYYSAFVQAGTTQLYTFSGAQPANYTFHFALTGSVTDERASLSASAGFFGDDLEVPLAANGVSVEGLPVGFPPPVPVGVNEAFSLTLQFNPGDAYTLGTRLSVGIVGMHASGITTADAMHTLRVTGIDGDLSLLQAQLLPVPEPGTPLLWLAGVAALARLRRRKLAPNP